MKEIDPLEKQLASWIPRRPSPEIAERLFGAKRRGEVAPAQRWSWLTPLAACALTLLVVVRGPMRHDADFDSGTNAAAVTALMYDPEASNTPRTFVLSRADLNVDLNAWPHLGPWRPVVRAPRLIPTATNVAGPSAEL